MLWLSWDDCYLRKGYRVKQKNSYHFIIVQEAGAIYYESLFRSRPAAESVLKEVPGFSRFEARTNRFLRKFDSITFGD
jgi:hypothetical protein